MTSPAIQLARECDFVPDDEMPDLFLAETNNIEIFYVKAQAQALRDAAKELNSVPMPAHWVVRALNEMVDKLEKQYV